MSFIALFNRMVNVSIVVIKHVSLQEIGGPSSLIARSLRSSSWVVISNTLIDAFKEFVTLLLLENHTFWNSSNRLIVWISQIILHVLAYLFLGAWLNMRRVVRRVIGILHVLVLLIRLLNVFANVYGFRLLPIFGLLNNILIRRKNYIWIRLLGAISKTSWWQGLTIVQVDLAIRVFVGILTIGEL